MIELKNPYLYAKGTCNVIARDIGTGDVILQSNKINTNNFTTTCDLSPVRSGFGNSIAIQIPQNAEVNLEIELANFSMAGKAMQVGAQVAYNGIGPVCKSLTASGATLTVPGEPKAPYGYNDLLCNVVEVGAKTTSGTTYFIDEDTKEIEGFVAESGKDYLVHYFEELASAEYFNISSNFAPGIYHITTQVGVYSTENTTKDLHGTLVGWLYHIIPRMQFSGNAATDGGQTTNAVTSLSGTALTYDNAAQVGVCTDCAISGLAQVLYVPIAGASSAVQGLFVTGGVVALEVGETKQIPVRYLMPNNTSVQPNYGDLEYVIASGGSAIASVSETGVLTGLGAGDTECTVTLDSPALSTVCNVEVTAP